MLYSYLVHYSVFSCIYVHRCVVTKTVVEHLKESKFVISKNVFVLRFDHKQNLSMNLRSKLFMRKQIFSP